MSHVPTMLKSDRSVCDSHATCWKILIFLCHVKSNFWGLIQPVKIETRAHVLTSSFITERDQKGLVRLYRGAGWSALMLFACNEFSRA